MKRLLVIISLLTMSMGVFAHQPKNDPFRRACYYYESYDMGQVQGWASAVGYGMAMMGYTDLYFHSGCVDEVCTVVYGYYCGTTPAGVPIDYEAGVEKSYSYPIKEMDRLKAECKEIITIKKGVMTNVTVSRDNIITMTYLLPK